jgi:archaeal arginyl aminopeptidase
MKALIVSTDMFEDLELLVPYYRLLEEKVETDIASINGGTIVGIHGYKVVAALSLNQIDPSLYDLLILPGGKAPSVLRKNEKMLTIVRHFFAKGKAVAAICHGPQILASAGVLSGKKATCYKSIAKELKSAGCRYSDQKVVVDGNLITSRTPADFPYFMREIIKKSKNQSEGKI